ncbi:MAG: peroxiredoxin-like family protein [Candidatus Kapaibacteriales bacterium]
MNKILKLAAISIVFSSSIFAIGCGEKGEADAETEVSEAETANTQGEQMVEVDPENLENADIPLMDKLEMRKAESMAKMDPEKAQTYEMGIMKVAESGAMDRILPVGTKAPDFTLPNTEGGETKLSDKLSEGPVVLVWYRGGWCPYCNLTLQAYADKIDYFKAAGASLIAISPEMADKAVATDEKLSLPFDVVSDKGNKTADKYGLTFTVDPETKKWYDKGFGMANYNGDDSGKLPLAGTYVIGKDGKVLNAFFFHDYRMRVNPEDVLGTLTQSKG